MRASRWLPEIARRHPSGPLRVAYEVVDEPGGSAAAASDLVEAALGAAGLRFRRSGAGRWSVSLEWTTMVLGFIRREVDEEIDLSLRFRPGCAAVHLSCPAEQTHNAHAVGCAGVLGMSALVWVTGGPVRGVSAAVATLLVGGLLADVMRTMAMTVLERRLRRLAEDVGSALWPGLQAQLLPRPQRD
jgi:hypothetical protein